MLFYFWVGLIDLCDLRDLWLPVWTEVVYKVKEVFIFVILPASVRLYWSYLSFLWQFSSASCGYNQGESAQSDDAGVPRGRRQLLGQPGRTDGYRRHPWRHPQTGKNFPETYHELAKGLERCTKWFARPAGNLTDNTEVPLWRS